MKFEFKHSHSSVSIAGNNYNYWKLDHWIMPFKSFHRLIVTALAICMSDSLNPLAQCNFHSPRNFPNFSCTLITTWSTWNLQHHSKLLQVHITIIKFIKSSLEESPKYKKGRKKKALVRFRLEMFLTKNVKYKKCWQYLIKA